MLRIELGPACPGNTEPACVAGGSTEGTNDDATAYLTSLVDDCTQAGNRSRGSIIPNSDVALADDAMVAPANPPSALVSDSLVSDSFAATAVPRESVVRNSPSWNPVQDNVAGSDSAGVSDLQNPHSGSCRPGNCIPDAVDDPPSVRTASIATYPVSPRTVSLPTTSETVPIAQHGVGSGYSPPQTATASTYIIPTAEASPMVSDGGSCPENRAAA